MELDRSSVYLGADLPRARRFSKLLWAIGNAIVLLVVPFYPPTALIGADGWWAFAACLPLLLGASVLVTRKTVGWRGLLVVTYVGLFAVTALQLLAGPDAPYVIVDLLLMCSVALIHPFPVAMPFAGAVVASRIGIALVEEGSRTDALVQALMQCTIWTLLAAVLCTLMRETRAQRLQLHDERSIDSLTRLPNRHAFDEKLDEEVERHAATGAPLAVIVADANGFKELNDRHGHLEGDRQLIAIARALESGVRPGDVCFRWGGDEFAVLLPGTDLPGATRVADRLAVLVAASCTDPEPLTIGVGYAQLQATDDAEAMLTRADAMLMEGKRGRRAATAVPAPA